MQIRRISTKLWRASVCTAVFAISISAQVQDRRQAAQQLLDEGAKLTTPANYWRPGKAAQALAKSHAALTLWRELNDRPQETATLLSIAEQNCRVGALEKCRDFGLLALDGCRALGDKGCEGRALVLASSHLEEGPEKALALLQQALAPARESNSELLVANIQAQIGYIRWTASEPQRALESLTQALNSLAANREALQSTVPQEYMAQLANTHFCLGLTFWTLGDYEKSLEHYAQSRHLRHQLGDQRWETTSLDNAGLVYEAAGQPAQALQAYAQTLPFWRETGATTAEADTLTGMSSIYVTLNNPAAALEHLKRAFALYEQKSNRYGFAYAWRIYGDAYAALGDDARAVDYYRKSAALQLELTELSGAAKAWAGLARVEARRGQLGESRQAIEKALDIIEDQRANILDQSLRATYFASRRNYYDFYISLLMRLHAQQPTAGHQLNALHASERARARSLLDLVASAQPNQNRRPPLHAAEIQLLVRPDTALLEYALGPEASFLFVVTSDQVRSYRLPPAAEIRRLVQETRTALTWPGRRHYARYAQAAQQLYSMLIAPAGEVLGNREHLIVVPDESLFYLPFEALITAPARRHGRADFSGLAYLLKRWTVSYAPSASVLEHLDRPVDKGLSELPPKELIAFADPAFNDRTAQVPGDSTTWPLPRLADAAREARGIADTWHPQAASLFLGQAATERNVKHNEDLHRARRIHFATHALISDRRPQYSSLVMTQAADNEDGLLQTAEIFRLKLSAEIVTLSACRTGLGQELRGEGLVGLTQAFLHAGAASVAVSLWQVSDESTAELMIDFYRQMTPHADKAAALRQAKLNLSSQDRYAHPYYWASFVLTGRSR